MFKLIPKQSILIETSVNLLNNQQSRSLRLRKPPWVPRAKGKQFRVPELRQKDMEEYNYMIPIWNHYKAEMRSIYQLFKTVAKFTDQASVKVKEEKRILKEKEAVLLLNNEKINKEILEKQLIEENELLEEKKRKAKQEYKQKLAINELFLKKADQKVRKLKEKAESFVDPNNLEYEIEKALNEVHDHNFSIDVSGRFYKFNTNVAKAQAFNTKFVPPSLVKSKESPEINPELNAPQIQN